MNENNKNQKSIIVMVLGILSIVLIFFGWSVLLGLACGIVAIVMAVKIKKQQTQKDSMVTAGFICGIVGTALSAIALIISVIFLVFQNNILNSFFNGFEDIVEIISENQNEIIDQAEEQIESSADSTDNYDELLDIYDSLTTDDDDESSSDAVLNSDTFTSEMENEGFTVYDLSADYIDNEEIEVVLVAIDETGNYQVEFYLMNTVDSAENLYEELKTTDYNYFENIIGNEESTSKYMYYDLYDFRTMSIKENTLIYSNSSILYKLSVENIFEDLNY